jgi:15-cis-phytoene synthase
MMPGVMQDAFSYCAELVHNSDRDRFIATLFAPVQRRAGLHALYAFNLEVARVRDIAREAMPGEIRLQWWREVLQRQREGEASASPTAVALLSTIEAYRLPVNALLTLIEARRFDLYSEPMVTIAQLEDYAIKTSSALFEMAAQILGADAAAAATLFAAPAPRVSWARSGRCICRPIVGTA